MRDNVTLADGSEREQVRPDVSRREVIRKALVAGGAAYVAPMVLASARPASAAVVVSGPVCTTCESDPDCPQDFICLSRVGASGKQCVFLGPLFCDDYSECQSDGDCDPGHACVVCKSGECLPCTLPA
jgi:hypothetical protein